MSELKKCPFCGMDVAELMTGSGMGEMKHNDEYAVVCKAYKGGCGASSGFKKYMEEAIELWNCRATNKKENPSKEAEPIKLSSTRESILAAAKQAVCTDREGTYGSPEDSFSLIAELVAVYLSATNRRDVTIRSIDVSVIMMLLKQARIASGGPHPDNWIDIAGYAACGGEIEGRGSREVVK
jgi:hypothetical protein